MSRFNKNITAPTISATLILAIAISSTLALIVAQSAQAQTFTILHSFTGGADESSPTGLSMDGAGGIFME